MYLVTGGLGFIGNELVRQLRRNGKVAILDNKNRVAPCIDDLRNVPVYEVDITDGGMRDLIVRLRPERVFHLAAIHYIPECNANPERTLRVNVEGTLSVLNACAEAGVKKVIVASSGAVYADSETPLDENAQVAPVDIYGWSKAFTEDLCRWISYSKGLPVIAARLFNNFGPRETNPHIIPEILFQLRKSDVLTLGNVSPIRDYIHTTDTADAMIALAQADLSGFIAVNIATGTGVSVRDLVRILGEQLGRTLRIEFDQARLRPVDKETQVADISLLRKLTGWEPRLTLRNGLRQLLTFEGLL
ncbi:MAG: NAD-dependent epimerase/dehydratase family protein [Desulfobacteraceae bacterium]|nr:MAG: NAD-dependent epimerase/dehydratase family protein [Desulfobacteraceae bacterium]